MHLAPMRHVGTPEWLASGSTHPLDNLPPDSPIKANLDTCMQS